MYLMMGVGVFFLCVLLAGCHNFEKLNRMVDAQADVEMKGVDRSVRQSVVTSQPITAGQDASNISPVVTINGSDSILVVMAGLVLVVGIVRYWRKSRKTILAMVRAIEETPDSERVRREIERAAYRSGVGQDIWNHVHRERAKKATGMK